MILMGPVENLILAGIEYIALMFLILKIVNEHFKKFFIAILIYAPVNLLIESLRIEGDFPVQTMLHFIAFTIFIKFILKKNFLTSIFAYLLSFFLGFFLQFLAMGLLQLLGVEISFVFRVGIKVVTLTAMISIILYLFVPLYKVIEVLKARKVLAYTIMIISTLFISASYYLRSQHHLTMLHNFEIIAVFSLVILVA